LKCDEDRKYRALTLSNLIAIYQKNELGKLSAYCGAVSASAGAGAGIAYLHKASFEVIDDTITNTLANVSGIVCDGAKASCAAKIASSVDAAEMAYYMAVGKNVFQSGEGLVKASTEKTIKSIGRMGREGMRTTDIEILRIMLEN
jgi:L-cysteine desulfidase